MKELLSDLAGYHAWADKRLLDAVVQLPQALCDREVASSFPTLTGTFAHLFWAATTWLRRLEYLENMPADEDFRGSFSELSSRLQAVDAALAGWIAEQSEATLTASFEYYNTKKQYFNMPVYQCLIQAFNHGTYHRGQVVTMFHELAISEIPGTDYILYKRLEQAHQLP